MLIRRVAVAMLVKRLVDRSRQLVMQSRIRSKERK